jgi:hypothetical protein
MIATMNKFARTTLHTGTLTFIGVCAIQHHGKRECKLHLANLSRACDEIGMAVAMVHDTAPQKINGPIMTPYRPIMRVFGHLFSSHSMSDSGYLF